MAKRGPKEKYRPEFCDVILETAAIPGQYRAAMLWEIGKKMGKNRPISPDTFARWRKQYPEFEQAWQDANIISQAIDERSLMSLARGESKGNVRAFDILFKAKYRDEYRPDTESGGNTTTINNLTIENMSMDELKYRIARSQEVLQKSGQLIELNPIADDEE